MGKEGEGSKYSASALKEGESEKSSEASSG
jgi:hypothetical protein